MSLLISNLEKVSVGFVGAGNMANAIISSLVESKTLRPEQIFVSNRSPGRLEKLKSKYGIQIVNTNEELIEKSQIVFAAMKPQDFEEAFEPIAKAFSEDQIFISIAAGITIEKIKKLLPDIKNIVRIMPNTAARINQAVVGYCLNTSAEIYEDLLQKLLSPLGYVVRIEEGESYEALTVAASSGIGFVFELMMYWQEWLEEHEFSRAEAREVTVETFLGAALLAHREEGSNLEDLQRQIVSKKGVTHFGLESMRELEIERLLRYSFEKAILRDRSLGSDKS